MANLIFRKNGTNYTIDGLIAGTGHLIKNSSGQEVTDRQFLQFVGADVTDDPVNDSTIITVNKDSGWLSTTAVNGNVVQYRKIGNQVWIRRSTIGTTSANTWTNIGVLPVGYRPSANVSSAIYTENNGSTYGGVQVLTNGNVNHISNLANNISPFFFSFLVD